MGARVAQERPTGALRRQLVGEWTGINVLQNRLWEGGILGCKFDPVAAIAFGAVERRVGAFKRIIDAGLIIHRL